MCSIDSYRSLLGEWPVAKQVSSSLTEVCLAFVRPANGWATLKINDKNNSLFRPSKGTLN